jgi:hypothetical protein
MKNIQPVQIWKDGISQTASVLVSRIIYDDLSNSCSFYWELRKESTTIDEIITLGETLASGNTIMDGQDYINWNGSNDAAYEFIAASINVIIIT